LLNQFIFRLTFVFFTQTQILPYQPTVTQVRGVDVMITIFCDYWPYSAKKLALFSKTDVMINCLQKLAVCSVSENANIFDNFFGENIF
jgi:hypothetical protein